MSDNIGNAFQKVSPLQERVVAIDYSPLGVPVVEVTPEQVTTPANYNLFTGTTAPDDSIGSSGDWYFLFGPTSMVFYEKQGPTWTLITSI